MAVKGIMTAAAAGILMGCFASPVLADSTGFAGAHDWRKEGGRTCFTDHYHYGSSSGMRTREAAIAEAARSWSSFTALEYGSDWASFGRAAGKKVSCSPTGGWSCSIEARPCR